MSAVPPPVAESGGLEVLVVDDNPATRYTTSRVLRAAGFRTREAATGSEALALASTGISAVILDVHLPDIDGFEVCGKIRTRPETALLPVIHLSASHVLDDDKVKGLDAGADAYMTHPAEPALLVATLQALIRARAAEEAMRRSDAGFRAIYEQAPSGISLLHLDGRFMALNPAMSTLLRRGSDQVVGKKLADFAPEEWRGAIAEALERSRSSVWRGEFPLIDENGQAIPVGWSLSADVRPGVILAIATDISERVALSKQRDELLEREQAARAAAEAVSRSKDEFIAVLSHELRTPLNAIIGWTEVLRRTVDPATIERGIEAIQRNVRVQTRLIADILDVSRIRLGKLPLELESIDVLQIVKASIAALAESVEEKSLDVSVSAPPGLRPVVADSARLQQIVWNLLTNAIKFSLPQGAIRVTISQDELSVTLTVEDEGQGIEPAFLPYVFDRFAQSDASSNRKHGGLGLGLSIVKQLVALHGGTVSAHSAGRDCGATFVVSLPRVATATAPVDAVPSRFDEPELETLQDGRLAGLVIGVVEDDSDAREVLGAILRSERATILEAGSYEAALAMLARGPAIDVLISDIGMPGKDGYDLMREIRHREQPGAPRLPAIALTAFARPKDREAALAAGFDAHCAKPVRPAAVIAAILAIARR